ncbi:MAG: ATP phosphoribosyltransferase [Candidatus Jordarchaeum sp.]|uniref:ATP phosphoribosyltransferase n=1 Tax=Candidatus Jordarchaeum sp. TaxID=2823881 RepID=UPI004048F9BF
MPQLKFVIPKGSLQEATLRLLKQAGYNVKAVERSYRPWINDPEISLKLLRPQEIPTLIQEGAHELGIAGEDWINESGAKVQFLSKLDYGKVSIVLAIPNSWEKVNSLSDLIKHFKSDGKPIRIATEYINITSMRIMQNKEYEKYYGNKTPEIITPWSRYGQNPNVKIMLSFGATEAKPPEDADAIVDNTETGTTLKSNELKIIEVFSQSEAVLIANKEALKDKWKEEKIRDVMTLIVGAVEARKKLHIFMNVKEENLEELLEQLPALKRPTISPLAGTEGWVAINTVIAKEEFLRLIPVLRRLAQGLVVYEPKGVLPLEEIRNRII